MPDSTMSKAEKTVFLSYRRTNAAWALAIYQNLSQAGFDVFFDFKGIASGSFEVTILANIRARAHFVVVLTPSALERCDEPDDWLRKEIESALTYQRNIVPLMLDGFSFNSPSIAKFLTGQLARLSEYNGLNVPVDYFDEGMIKLRQKYLNIPTGLVLHPATNEGEKFAKEQQAAARTAVPVERGELSAVDLAERGNAASEAHEKLRCYNESIRLKPDFAIVYNNRGTVHHKLSDYKTAILDYDQALRLDPSIAVAYLNRGSAHNQLFKYKAALADLNRAIELQPSSSRALVERGLTRRELQDSQGAMEDYSSAIQFDADNADAYQGRIYIRGYHNTASIQDYAQLLRLRPNAEAFLLRGNLYAQLGSYEKAIADYNSAVRLEADYDQAYVNRAHCRLKLGDKHGSKADMATAAQIKRKSSLLTKATQWFKS